MSVPVRQLNQPLSNLKLLVMVKDVDRFVGHTLDDGRRVKKLVVGDYSARIDLFIYPPVRASSINPGDILRIKDAYTAYHKGRLTVILDEEDGAQYQKEGDFEMDINEKVNMSNLMY